MRKGIEQDRRFAAVIQRQGSFLPMETLLTGFEQLLFDVDKRAPTVLTATPQLGLQAWQPKASL